MKEGCNVKGFMKVARVAGNMNIVPGKFLMKNARYVLDTQQFEFNGTLVDSQPLVAHDQR